MTSDVETFLNRCRALGDGFSGAEPTIPWRLGAVLFAKRYDQFAAVQKSERGSYEFSNKWALPGGMVRAADAVPDFKSHTLASVANRAFAEARVRAKDLKVCTDLGPVVTAYSAHGARRFTLIAAFEGLLALGFDPCPSDPSIQAARLAPFSTGLDVFAPANQLIIGHLVWPYLDAAKRASARDVITVALKECTERAGQVGVRPPSPPWASALEIKAWSRSWPMYFSAS